MQLALIALFALSIMSFEVGNSAANVARQEDVRPQGVVRPAGRNEALFEAASKGDVTTLEASMASGVPRAHVGPGGVMASICAAARGRADIVKALPASGTGVSAENEAGLNALTGGAAKVRGGMAQTLKGAGADSEKLAREAQEVAGRFNKRLQETRDFQPLIKEFFVRRYVDCSLAGILAGREIMGQISVSIRPEVAKQARIGELRRYLVEILNLYHLVTLHSISARDMGVSHEHGVTIGSKNGYPPGVFELLMKNPTIAATAEEHKGRGGHFGSAINQIKSVEQLRSILPTLQRATSMMREYFTKHPPEEMKAYWKSLNYISGVNAANWKFMEPSIFEASFKSPSGESGRRCLGLPETVQLINVKIPPFYNLILIRKENKARVIGFIYTSPPYAD